LKLVEKGLIDLDAPLNSYLSETGIEQDPRIGLITMRQALSHTCGLPNWRPKGEPLKIRLTPGERFSYSGEGYMLLQRVIEHLTRRPGEEWMQHQLLKALGMEKSSYIWSGEDELSLANGHDEKNKPVAKRVHNDMGAAYSLNTTATDFARFMCAIMQPMPHNETYLSPATLDMMLTPHVAVNDSAPWQDDWPKQTIMLNPQVAWGLGWGIQQNSHTSFWHWGDNFCYTAFAVGFHKEGIGVVIMTNNSKGYDLFEGLCLEAIGSESPAVRWLRSLFN
jgi:CubicO group peptidase (beta-lactamase class C family)